MWHNKPTTTGYWFYHDQKNERAKFTLILLGNLSLAEEGLWYGPINCDELSWKTFLTQVDKKWN